MTTAAPSFWWRSLEEPPPPRPPLTASAECDVAVVGAGYTGLWAAWYLKQAQPDLHVVVLEREWAGFGASGRNGGWLSGLLPGSREAWARRQGRPAVVAAQRALNATIGEVESFCVQQDVDCDLVRGGTLAVATGTVQLRRLEQRLAYEREWGFGEEDWRGLGPDELAERLRVAGALGGLWSPHCARLQPAKLVRGLAAEAERAGVVIHERTPVTAISPRRLRTPSAELGARWIIQATEGYTAGLPGRRRDLVPLNSSMIVTEPLDDAHWAEIGWEGCETMRDAAHVFVYLQRTGDGRIAIGGRGVPYRYGSRTDRCGEVPAATARQLRGRVEALFPVLREAAVADAWTGVLGVARDWSPSVGADPGTGLAWAGGYVGDGVSTSNLFGRVLRDLLLERDSEIARLPFVGRHARRWEPEPLRYVAIRGIYAAYRHADRTEARTGRRSPLARAADVVANR